MHHTFHVQYSLMRSGYEFNIVHRDHAGNASLAKTVEYEALEPGAYILPLLTLTDGEAQQLLQALWNAGLRPNNGEGTVAAVESIKYHLEDMRRIVFDRPYIVEPVSLKVGGTE